MEEDDYSRYRKILTILLQTTLTYNIYKTPLETYTLHSIKSSKVYEEYIHSEWFFNMIIGSNKL